MEASSCPQPRGAVDAAPIRSQRRVQHFRPASRSQASAGSALRLSPQHAAPRPSSSRRRCRRRGALAASRRRGRPGHPVCAGLRGEPGPVAAGRACRSRAEPEVTNRTQDGSLWLGVFSEGTSGHGGLHAGTLHSFAPDTLAQQTEQVRDALQQVQGTAHYRYDGPLDASNRDERARHSLSSPSRAGASTTLSSIPTRRSPTKTRTARRGPRCAGTISIARCSLSETSIPWAALYDRPLDIGGGTAPTVCPVFLDQLAAGKDLLDEPAKCHELPTCPLKGEAARNTVCPFGFWGIRQPLEQPLKQLSVENERQAAEELTSPAFVESCRVPASEGKPPALMGYGTNIPTGSEHLQELQQLSGSKSEASADRAKVLTHPRAGPRQPALHLLPRRRSERSVRLPLPPAVHRGRGPEPQEGTPAVPRVPERLQEHGHAPRGHQRAARQAHAGLGALAVIGSEIKINNLFARPFATRVLGDFLQGRSLGEAFLGSPAALPAEPQSARAGLHSERTGQRAPAREQLARAATVHVTRYFEPRGSPTRVSIVAGDPGAFGWGSPTGSPAPPVPPGAPAGPPRCTCARSTRPRPRR